MNKTYWIPYRNEEGKLGGTCGGAGVLLTSPNFAKYLAIGVPGTMLESEDIWALHYKNGKPEYRSVRNWVI